MCMRYLMWWIFSPKFWGNSLVSVIQEFFLRRSLLSVSRFYWAWPSCSWEVLNNRLLNVMKCDPSFGLSFKCYYRTHLNWLDLKFLLHSARVGPKPQGRRQLNVIRVHATMLEWFSTPTSNFWMTNRFKLMFICHYH